MSNSAPFTLRSRNPDVLMCIANLSNDEVFTPPDFANQMLDTLAAAWAADHDGADIWADKTVRFLDPCTKSGVFLREITSRLTEGLADKIPDLEERVHHILTHQVFGIAITHLTSLLARRSVYCSKHANGKYSIAKGFASDDGNIWFERMEHTWVNGRCKYCGTSAKTLDRGEGLETHAYAFIHTDDIKARLDELLGGNMQFDVIIGNPPYQLNDGGGSGTSAAPIYQLFVQAAKQLEPRYLSMIIPARWFSGGKGLDEFRKTMLSDDRLRILEDYPDSNDVFPGTQIKGGICYFLWDRDQRGDVTITTHDKGEIVSSSTRPLLEDGTDVFIRYNEALPILRKIAQVEAGSDGSTIAIPDAKRFSTIVSTRRPFGLSSTYHGKATQTPGDVTVFEAGGRTFADRSDISQGRDLIDKWKVFIPFLASGSDAFPHAILGRPFLGEPGTVSTETYLVIGPFTSQKECENAMSYISTRFFRFIVLQKKPSQNATRKVYDFVPLQDFSTPWTDKMLYEKYSITDDEITFIEKMVRPMDLGVEVDDD